MRMRRRGLTMGMVLLLIAIVVVLGSTLVSGSLAHRILLDRESNGGQALDLARSAVSLTIARLQMDRSFGTTRRPQDEVSTAGVVDLPGLPEGAVGRVTFAQVSGRPWSTNSLEQPDSVTGCNGTVLPGHSAHLWGVGECGGVTRRVEAILTVPAFPYALAANGRVESRGSLRVAGLESLPETGASLDESKLTSASLLSNAPGGGAVKLAAGSEVRGDVRAVGAVELEPGARVDGRVMQVEPGPLSELRLSDYDPRSAGLACSDVPLGTLNAPCVAQNSALRCPGDLRLEQGLQLDGGLLFVNGDLTVQGGIQGKGLVVCTGNLSVEGRNQLQAGEGVAVLAGGDVKLAGSGAEGSFFQGLVYTAGGLETDSITLVGALMATGNQSAVTLKDSRVVMPEPVMQKAEWSYGGGGGGYSDHSKYAVYLVMTPSGPVTKADLQPGEVWNKAYVLQRQADGSFTQWTFTAGGGSPTPQTRDADWVRRTLQLWLQPGPGDLAFANEVNRLTPPPNPEVAPPPPPASPGTTARLTVQPSQFLKLEDRMRVALWLES